MNKPAPSSTSAELPDWQDITTVLLDMDGTLLDKYFDDYFWEKHVPAVFAEKHQLSPETAEQRLLTKYRSVESTLEWTDLYYWSDRLKLDIPQLKRDISHLINVHDHVYRFLDFIKSTGKKLYLVTNAHPKTLEIKLEKTAIHPYFDRLICAEEIGKAKEQPEFWQGLAKIIAFEKETTLLADDTEKVLRSAKLYGIRHLLHIAKPSSKLETAFSSEFLSIADFSVVTPQERVGKC